MIPATSVGIELGGNDLRLTVLKGTARRFRVVATHQIAGFAALTEPERREAVAALVRKHAIPAGRVFLNLPASAGIVRQLEFPAQIRDKVRSAVELQIENLSPWPLDEVYWECSVGRPPDSAANRNLVVTVLVIPRSTVDQWANFFRSAGLPLSGCTLSPVAWAGVVDAAAHKAPVLVLHCGETGVAGIAVSGPRMVCIEQHGETVAETAREVAGKLTALARIPAGSARLICHGSLSETILPDARRAFPPPPEFESAAIADYGSASAALAGLSGRHFRANLMPAAARYQRSRWMLAPTGILLLLAVAAVAALALVEPYHTYLYAQALDAEIARLAPEVRELNRQETELNGLEQRRLALEAHIGRGQANLELLDELSRILPSDTWLASYNFQSGTITLTGFSDRASEIQRILEDSALFQGVQFTAPITRERNKDRFSIRVEMEGR